MEVASGLMHSHRAVDQPSAFRSKKWCLWSSSSCIPMCVPCTVSVLQRPSSPASMTFITFSELGQDARFQLAMQAKRPRAGKEGDANPRRAGSGTKWAPAALAHSRRVQVPEVKVTQSSPFHLRRSTPHRKGHSHETLFKREYTLFERMKVV